MNFIPLISSSQSSLQQIIQNKSLFNRSLNWFANQTYRKLPKFINNIQKKSINPQQYTYEDYLYSPDLAKEVGKKYVKNLKILKNYNRDNINITKNLKQRIEQNNYYKKQNYQKPLQLICPICLQWFNGPVTTSCSHTFCHMCIDQAILFNPNCPVCRNQIRGQQFIVSKILEKIIFNNLLNFQTELDEFEKFVSKEKKYRKWLSQRFIKKLQLDVGDCIDVRDTQFVWCKATILQIYTSSKNQPFEPVRQSILVHYQGWSSIYDQVISLESQRLSCFKFYTSREQIPHYNLDYSLNQHLHSYVIIGGNENNDFHQNYLTSQNSLIIQDSNLQDYFNNIHNNLNNMINSNQNLYQQQRNYNQSLMQSQIRDLDAYLNNDYVIELDSQQIQQSQIQIQMPIINQQMNQRTYLQEELITQQYSDLQNNNYKKDRKYFSLIIQKKENICKSQSQNQNSYQNIDIQFFLLEYEKKQKCKCKQDQQQNKFNQLLLHSSHNLLPQIEMNFQYQECGYQKQHQYKFIDLAKVVNKDNKQSQNLSLLSQILQQQFKKLQKSFQKQKQKQQYKQKMDQQILKCQLNLIINPQKQQIMKTKQKKQNFNNIEV